MISCEEIEYSMHTTKPPGRKWTTEQQTHFIVQFLKERIEFLTISHIEKHLGLTSHELGHILCGQKQTLSPYTIEIASLFLEETFGFKMPAFKYTVKEVLTCISRLSKIPVKELTKHTRKRVVVEARQIAMFLYIELNETKDIGFVNIGEEFGKFDHSTVSYVVKTVNNLIETDSGFRDKVDYYRAEIKYQNNLNPNLTE